MENKKNTVLLTVIAVATLLVAVVGATFAYFSAQGGAQANAAVTVTTGTAAEAKFGTLTAINIYADASTFTKADATTGEGSEGNLNRVSHQGVSDGTVTWKAPGATDNTTPNEAERTFCYTASLNITTNTFGYSTQNTDEVAELEFSATKDGSVIIDKKDITVGTESVKIPTAKDGSDYIHSIIAEAGQTETDVWVLTVSLVNHNFDQTSNTGKQFAGQVYFDKVDCQ